MRDKEIEGELEKRGVEYTFVENLPLSDVDMEASLRNQVRMKALQDDNLASIQAALEAGSDTKCLLAIKDSKGKRVVMLDGNHRVKASNNLGWGAYPFGCYVITSANEKQRRTLMVWANSRHGERFSKVERLIHGSWLVEAGELVSDAARAVVIPAAALGAYMRSMEGQRRLVRLGVKVDLVDTTVERLHSIHLDDVFAATSRFVADCRVPPAEVSQIVKRINRESSLSAQMAIVDKENGIRRKLLNMAAGSTRSANKSMIFMRTIIRSITALERVSPEQLRVIPDNLKVKVAGKLNDGLVHLRALKKVMLNGKE
jgi:hypothetical protein